MSSDTESDNIFERFTEIDEVGAQKQYEICVEK